LVDDLLERLMVRLKQIYEFQTPGKNLSRAPSPIRLLDKLDSPTARPYYPLCAISWRVLTTSEIVCHFGIN
jgi:hypothetical protein